MRTGEKPLRDLELLVEHSELGQIVQERARVEDADDQLLAEGHRDGGDAHLDLAIPPRRLDASVLRASLLRDVEAGERLDARHDGRVHHLGQLVDVVQHAVDAHAHDGGVASRLDVDVAGALVERVVKDVLDGGDDVAVAGLDLLDALELHVSFEVADVDAGGHLLLGGVHRAPEPVEVGDEPLDVARRRDDQAWLPAHVRLERLDERVVEGVGDGDGHRVIVGLDDERAVAPREGAREELRRELGVDLERIEVDVRKPHVLREGLHHEPLAQREALVAGLTEPQRDQRLGRVHAVRTARTALARPARAQPKEACVRHVTARHGVAFLLRREQPSLLQDAAEILESQCGARTYPCSMGRVGRGSRHGQDGRDRTTVTAVTLVPRRAMCPTEGYSSWTPAS